LIDGRHGHPRKAHSALREWLYARKQGDEEVHAPQLVTEVKEKFGRGDGDQARISNTI